MLETLQNTQLFEENERLKKELENMSIMIQELEQTNSNLISATWRERELKKMLANTLSQLEQSKNVIEKQNFKISESINYSKRIQDVILAGEQTILSELAESFTLFIPKDVVSGDFPFFHRNNGTKYLAAVDCTGHGVPGAMLSLIGHLILVDILDHPEQINPSEVLLRLHSRMVKTLKQDISGNDASDGMDIALCQIDDSSNIVRFSGAHRPLYQIRNGKLTEYRGSRLPIGGNQYKKSAGYSEHEIAALPGDLFFLFSDGFQDQFGGTENEKYGPLRLQEYLLKTSDLPMQQIKEGLRNEFINWKGEKKQMDDILFIGFKY